LRILGRGWGFDDVAEATGMSEQTARTSFLKFCTNFVQSEYSEYIQSPAEDVEVLQKVSSTYYEKLGLPGCIGSVDCVHIRWDKCPVG
jgi:hypothetical protein